MRTSFSRRLGSAAMKESVLASRRAVMRSMSLTRPCSLARALNSSSSPARTVRLSSWRCDDLQALLDLLLVGAGAVAAEQELADVGGHRVLALEACAPGPCGRCSRRRPRRRSGRARRAAWINLPRWSPAAWPRPDRRESPPAPPRPPRAGRPSPAARQCHPPRAAAVADPDRGRKMPRPPAWCECPAPSRRTALQLHPQAQPLPLGAGDLDRLGPAG